ncbi:MAG: histidine kinase dimerization/phospho-acceptor domain-containing protein, partial [Bacteroidota bacterium]
MKITSWLTIFLLLVSFNNRGYCQATKNLPKLYPSRIQPFQDNTFFQNYCVNKIIKTPDGRLWMPTCRSLKSSYDLPLLQYDGYTFRTLELDLPILGVSENIHFEGYVPNLGIIGCINTPWKSIFFVYNHRSGEVTHMPLPEGMVGAIYARSKDAIWFFQTLQDGTQVVYFWDGTQLIKEAELILPASMGYTSEGNRFKVNPGKAIWVKESIYYSNRYFGLIRYDPNAKSLLAIPDHLEGMSPSDSPCPKSNGDMNISILNKKDSIFIAHLSNRINMVKWVHSEERWERLFDGRECIRNGSIFQDSIGNILFCAQQVDKKYEAVLLDLKGRYWDFSPMIEDLPFIFSIASPNFFEQLLIATQAGALSIEVQQENAIATLFEGQDIRKVLAVDTSSFLVKPQKKEWQLVQGNNIVDGPSIFPKLQVLKKGNYHHFVSKDSVLFLLSSVKQEDGLYHYLLADLKSDLDATWIRSPRKAALGFLEVVTDTLGKHKILALDIDETNILLTIDPEKYQLDTFKIRDTVVQIEKININHTTLIRDGSYWICASEGLFQLHPQRGIFNHFNEQHGFTDARMMSLHEMPNGHLWVGTVTSGIQVFDPIQQRVVQIIDSGKGLSNNTVPIILSDDDGDVWAGTFNGLNLIAPQGQIITRLFVEDGLPDNEFNRFAFDKLVDGRLLLGTTNGLCIIDPQSLKQNLRSQIAQIYISKLTYYDQDKEELVSTFNYEPQGPPLQLPANRRNLIIKVAMSNYGHTSTNIFSYQLEGIDTDWNVVGSYPVLNLSNLPAGKYRLLISGVDDKGNWAAAPIAIPLYVRDYFYKEYWFYALCLLALVIIALIWIRYLQQQRLLLRKEVAAQTQQIRADKTVIEQQANELREVDALKSRFFANISHELRTPITLITTPIENLIKKYGDKVDPHIQRSHEMVYQNAKKLGGLVEELLELSRLDAGKQDLTTTPTDL